MATAFTLRRTHTDGLSTVGELAGSLGFLCYTLEPGALTPIHPRIPAGIHPVRARPDLGKAAEYRARFGAAAFPFIVEIVVPGRSFVEFHIGNTVADTEGCVMAGSDIVPPEHAASRHWEVVSSTAAYLKAYPALRDALLAGDVSLTVVEEG